MKKSIILVIIIFNILLSCKTQKKVTEKNISRYYEYSERDLNLLIAIDFLKKKHPKCDNNECSFSVRGLFQSYNDCFNAHLSSIVDQTGYDFDNSFEVFQSVDIEGWGSIRFGGTVMGEYNFAPVMVDEVNGKIFGQVYYEKFGRDKFEDFSYDVIGDNLFFSGVSYVHDGSCYE